VGYEALTKRKNDLQESLAVELTENTINNLLKYRKAVALGLENPTFEDRRRWLEILQTRVIVTNEIAVITCRLEVNPLEYRLFELHEHSSILRIQEFSSIIQPVMEAEYARAGAGAQR
jgi:hypothetical protein